MSSLPVPRRPNTSVEPARSRTVALLSWAALLTVPIALATTSPAVITPQLMLIGVGLTLLSPVIPNSLEFRLPRQVPARTFGTLMSPEPAAAALAG